MRAVLYLDSRATYADYLAAERLNDIRHEYVEGVIVAMAGGSDEHNTIASRFGGLCLPWLSGVCRHYTADQRFWIAATGRGAFDRVATEAAEAVGGSTSVRRCGIHLA